MSKNDAAPSLKAVLHQPFKAEEAGVASWNLEDQIEQCYQVEGHNTEETKYDVQDSRSHGET